MGVLALRGRGKVIRFTLFHRDWSEFPAAARGGNAPPLCRQRIGRSRFLARAADEHLVRLLLGEVELGHGILSWTKHRLLGGALEETMPADAETA